MSCYITELSVRRGTTPTLAFSVDIDLTVFEKVHVAFLENRHLLVKEGDDIRFYKREDGGTNVVVTLSQADTLSWKEGKAVEVQVRYKRGEKADASSIGVLQIERLLEEGEI
ncbi:MAG: hypothetical protein IJ111_01180 [Eggerthellaceae bacterium]|nr:hypothetical protein [Eggerthellaceae bacterium]